MLSALLALALGSAGCLPNQFLQAPPEEGDLFGFALARLGDLDGDGVAELAIGCPLVGGDQKEIGQVFVLALKSGKVLTRLEGYWSHDCFGECVASPGDLDGDGHGDLLVENCDPEGHWFVHATSSRSAKELHVADAGLLRMRDFGGPRNLACLGDLTGDAVPDYAVLRGLDPDWEHPRTCVRLVSGRDGSTVMDIGDEGSGVKPYNEVASAGDVDGDGVQDLAVARWRTDAAIEIWSLKRPHLLRTIQIEGAGTAWRITLAGGRDLDQDGVPDLLAGVIFVDSDPRSGILAISGKSGSRIRTWRQRSSGEFARHIECLDDLNADGVAELLVGAPQSTSHDSWAGVLDGAKDSAVFERTSSAWDESFYGVSGCGVGDVDGDGVPDYVVGAASWKARGAFPGVVRLFSGRTGLCLKSWSRLDLLAEKR